jgi:glycosyltransferase involved in cell wall biosynthesis
MNILQIISSGGMYGAESVILNLLRSLNHGAHRSVLGVFANASNPNLQLHDLAVNEGIDSRLIACNGQVDWSVISRIRELTVQTGADIVHCHGYKADIYAFLALGSTGIPLVSTCHTWYDNDLRVYLYGVLDRFVLRKYARVIAVSEEVRQRLLRSRTARERITVIRNGIDLIRFNAAALLSHTDRVRQDSIVVGLVGRLSREKGVDIFLRAASIVLADYPNTMFVVAGDGPDRSELERLIDSLGIASKVSLLGRRDDMPSVYRSFDVMVSSSRKEGLPVVILEGMATGLPVVATRVGEVPNLIQDGETGLLVQPNAPRALAEAIVKLLVNEEHRNRLGCTAKKLIEREFSAERMAAEYIRVYKDAIAVRADRAKSKGET